ncbi:MAG: MoxR family ATPase [Gammaproteobacteria bacterium]|nr:MoxR family ATPase [Gammaproteobacteria bacterium]MDH4313970.1 MoxR family ATPase [Gammaproteobacteria bacterium]MDH5212704.1 MoxR family ATPase [Gammaproteobacteria bacterium]MDH5499916.1 MoxR family ATPase [Gammaproteobacteria bacterium]
MTVHLKSENRLADWSTQAQGMERAINLVMVGQETAVRLLCIATFARGHVILEGNVGVGKTTLLRAAARTLGGGYERIEGTVDLMPSDLIYHAYVDTNGKPQVAPGPLLKHGESLAVFFFNEVNRARPQMHSLMLRVMAERSVSAFNREYRFPHLQVFADRNRVEREETFEIPAAARDRFLMEIEVEAPQDREQLYELMVDTRFHDADKLLDQVPAGTVDYRELNAIARTVQDGVQTSKAILDYAFDLCRATSDPAAFGIAVPDTDMTRLIQAGVSPRGMSFLLRAARVAAWLNGRDSVMPEDLHEVFLATVAHRIFFRPAYELRRTEMAKDLIDRIMRSVAAP